MPAVHRRSLDGEPRRFGASAKPLDHSGGCVDCRHRGAVLRQRQGGPARTRRDVEQPHAGGCAGRRRLVDALGQPDPYCPVVRGDDRRLTMRIGASRELPKVESACTTVVVAR
jgi:hypothetical protein